MKRIILMLAVLCMTAVSYAEMHMNIDGNPMVYASRYSTGIIQDTVKGVNTDTFIVYVPKVADSWWLSIQLDSTTTVTARDDSILVWARDLPDARLETARIPAGTPFQPMLWVGGTSTAYAEVEYLVAAYGMKLFRPAASPPDSNFTFGASDYVQIIVQGTATDTTAYKIQFQTKNNEN